MKHILQLAITAKMQWSNSIMMTWSHGNAILIPDLYWGKFPARCLTVHHWRPRGIAVHHWLPCSGPVMQGFDVTFVISLNKLYKHLSCHPFQVGWWTRDLIYWLQVTPRTIRFRHDLFVLLFLREHCRQQMGRLAYALVGTLYYYYISYQQSKNPWLWLKSYHTDWLQWNLSVTTTSIMKFIACDLFSNVF